MEHKKKNKKRFAVAYRYINNTYLTHILSFSLRQASVGRIDTNFDLSMYLYMYIHTWPYYLRHDSCTGNSVVLSASPLSSSLELKPGGTLKLGGAPGCCSCCGCCRCGVS